MSALPLSSVFKAHILLHHSTLGLRVIKKKRRRGWENLSVLLLEEAVDERLQLLYRNVQRFRGGLVFKAHRLVYHSTLGSRVIKKKGPERASPEGSSGARPHI